MERTMKHIDEYAIEIGQYYVHADADFYSRGVTPEAAFMSFISKIYIFGDYIRKSREKLFNEQAN